MDNHYNQQLISEYDVPRLIEPMYINDIKCIICYKRGHQDLVNDEFYSQILGKTELLE